MAYATLKASPVRFRTWRLRLCLRCIEHWFGYIDYSSLRMARRLSACTPPCTDMLRGAGCEAQGALYAFPRLTLPEAAHAAAAAEGVAPDFLYCRELLEATGAPCFAPWPCQLARGFCCRIRDVGLAEALGYRSASCCPDPLCREAAGVVAVPGSGFKQAEGTLHVRLTILPPEEDMACVIDGLATFHANFLSKYATS